MNKSYRPNIDKLKRKAKQVGWLDSLMYYANTNLELKKDLERRTYER